MLDVKHSRCSAWLATIQYGAITKGNYFRAIDKREAETVRLLLECQSLNGDDSRLRVVVADGLQND